VSDRSPAGRRVRFLLRWYPKAWRLRYGEEFAALLLADMAERPRSWRRTLDVARSGVAARLGSGGLVHGLGPRDRAHAHLASLVCAGAGFLLIGLTMWSQLAIGWQWSRPSASATTTVIVVMSGLLAGFAALVILAAIPIVWALAARLVARRAQEIVVPLLLFAAGAAIVILGARHFALGWPGTGGHPWAHQHLLPGRVAAFAWAATLSITSYWAHPGALLAFPPGELAWMAASPVALVGVVAGGAKTVRRLELSPRALRFEVALARLGFVAMIAFVVAACCWIAAGNSGPRNLFHIGAIDFVGVAVMTAALLFARRAAQDARAALAHRATGG
jgi:hypothetical protein